MQTTTAKCGTKFLVLFLSLLLMVTMFPARVFAADSLQGDTNGNGTVDVTLTISEGVDNFYTTETGDQMFKKTLNVPYFDLELYDLDQYYYNPDCYASGSQPAGTKETANGVVTTMHVFIYATERFMLEMDPEECGKGEGDIGQYISWTQGAGSTFMKFWNGSTNLNYYLDYQYPLGRPGWGSTSDQQALTDGVSIDIHLIEDPYVSGSQYSFFETERGVRDFAKVTEGTSATLTLNKTISSYGDVTKSSIVAENNVYYIEAGDYNGQKVTKWTSLGTTDEHGQITIPDTLTPGTYYISSKGEVDGTGERGAAAFVLEVKEYVEFQYGDVNNDGSITSYDASLVLQYLAGNLEADELVLGAADVSGDGVVTSYDVSLILQRIAGNFNEFPVE